MRQELIYQILGHKLEKDRGDGVKGLIYSLKISTKEKLVNLYSIRL